MQLLQIPEMILSAIAGALLHHSAIRIHDRRATKRVNRSIWDHLARLGDSMSLAVSSPVLPPDTPVERPTDSYVADAIRMHAGIREFTKLPVHPRVTQIEDLSSHLLIVGSPKYNHYATMIQQQYDTRIQFVSDQYHGEPVSSMQKLVTRNGEEYVATKDLKLDHHDAFVDYGIVFNAVLRNGKNVLWLAGIHGPGTIGLYKAFLDKPHIFAEIKDMAPGQSKTWLFRITHNHTDDWGHKGCESHILSEDPLGAYDSAPRVPVDNPINTIIFDLGNVLMAFDRTRTYRALGHLLHRDWRDVQNSVESSHLPEQYELGAMSTDEFRHKLCAALKVKDHQVPSHLFAEFWGDIFFANGAMIRALQTLDERHTYTLVLLSNTNELHFENVTRNFREVTDPFRNRMLLSYREHLDKSSKEIYEKAVSMSGPRSSASQCVYIDDKPSNVSMAEAVGMRGLVYFKYPHFVVRMRELGIYLS